MVITSYIIAVDNFWHHIWNQHSLLVDILENKENQRTLLIPVRPGLQKYAIEGGTVPPSIMVLKLEVGSRFGKKLEVGTRFCKKLEVGSRIWKKLEVGSRLRKKLEVGSWFWKKFEVLSRFWIKCILGDNFRKTWKLEFQL